MSKLATYLSSNGIAELLGSRPGYLTIQAAAYYASVSERTIKRWIARGLPSFQGSLRGKVLIRPGDIDLYMQKKPIPVEKHDLDAMVEGVLKSFCKAQATGKIPQAPSPEAIGLPPGLRKPRQGKWTKATRACSGPEAPGGDKKGTVPDSDTVA